MKKTTFYNLTLCFVICGIQTQSSGQGTIADYERADALPRLTRGKVYKTRFQLNPIVGSDSFWYDLRTGPQSHEFVLVDAAAGQKTPAFNHRALATALSARMGNVVDPENLPFQSLEFSPDRDSIRFISDGQAFQYDLSRGTLKAVVRSTEKGVTSLRRIRSSGKRGPETVVRFVNRLSESLRIFWVNEEGRWIEYEPIPEGGQRSQHSFANHVWVVTDKARQPIGVYVSPASPCDIVIDQKTPIEQPRKERRYRTPGSDNRSTSPDGKWKVSIVDSNVVIRDIETGQGEVLSKDGTGDDPYIPRFYWSPDSSRLVAIQQKPAESHVIHMVESSPKDDVQPKLKTMNYLKPGDQIAMARPKLFDVGQKRQISVDNTLFSNPWRINEVRWRPDSGSFSFLYNERGHQVMRIVSVDSITGQVHLIVDESSQTFIDYSGKQFSSYHDPSDSLIWMSERDGWNHLYLIDLKEGQVKRQLTKGDWVVRGVDRVDWELGKVWVRIGGYYPEQDPYYVHHAVVDLLDGGLTLLTRGDGDHQIEFLKGGAWLVDRYSRVDMPMVAELRNAKTGELVCELERGDCSRLLETGWKLPERFQAKGRDGVTNIYGVIYRPSNFQPEKSYPVIEDIYAGPHSSFVPKRFGTLRRGQILAELGFVVVQIDGMGTSNRSKAFHDVCHKNLGDSGFPDRILWIRAAAEKYPSFDLDRIGIFGGSAGGQSSLRALLAFGEFYKVAVSDCGCHDNRMDKIWWNELWMGWPVGPHYEEQSNVTQAHRLEGKLLLTVGELDRNVDPASTMQVVDALVKANKDFDFVMVPGAGHGVGESPYLKRRRRDFFVRHLLGVEPRRLPESP